MTHIPEYVFTFRFNDSNFADYLEFDDLDDEMRYEIDMFYYLLKQFCQSYCLQDVIFRLKINFAEVKK